jgi:hypothetical protein
MRRVDSGSSDAANCHGKVNNSLSKLITTLLVMVLGVHSAAAASLLNYEHRVVRAAEQIERIKADKDYGEEGISYIRRLLPRSEQVEWDRREVVVDNKWLHDLLDSYDAETDPQERVARLNEAVGKLRALDDHLKRAQGGTDGENPRDRLREILSRPAYQPEQETVIGKFVKSVLRKVRGFIGQAYSALQRLLEKILGAGANGGWVSNLFLMVLLAAALIFVVQMARKRRVPRAKRKKTRLILGEEIAADGTSRELAEAGLAAARAGDFRTAIRKLYISFLYELADRGLIELEDSATNHEYLRKVSRFNSLVSPMNYMTDRFDYVWYGMFPSSEEEFAAYRTRYEEAMERARSINDPAGSAL